MEETDKHLTLYPIGGLGEIGLNCLLLETNYCAVLVDCGLMFPDELHYGVDVIIPRLDFIWEKKEKLQAIILTHGHEDHIGALPWLMADLDVPIYSSRFTLALVANKLREYHPSLSLDLRAVEPRQRIELGGLAFSFFPVCHSIIHGYALGIETPVGRMVHSGDFKIDRNPLGGHATDLEGIREFSRPGVSLLLSDSTNVEREGYALTEKEIKLTLKDIFSEAQGRILVTLFSSHIQRIQEIYDLTRQFGRKMSVSGKSLITNIEIARELGELQISEENFCNLEELRDEADENIVLLVTGSQGEPMSVMNRLIEGTHRQLQIHRGDTVVISSRFIPGNTKTINKVINRLYKLGAEVMYEKVQAVHASGHAHREELKLMLDAVNPKFFIPVHGEYRHLVKHARLARDCGVTSERCLILEDGHPLTFLPDGIRFGEEFSVKSILVDGKGVGDVGRSILKERQLLADEGMVIVVLVLDNETGEIIMGPRIQSKGFIFEQEFAHILKEAESIAMEVYSKVESGSSKKLRDKIKSALRRYFRNTLQRDPVVVPLVINI